jgi:hypothetical protein
MRLLVSLRANKKWVEQNETHNEEVELRLAIMQPYFLPYIGYWQLIAAVDVFVVYDNIKYTKKGWINRNRFLLNGKDAVFTLPLRKGSDFLHVNQRQLADTFDREDLIKRFREAYRKAPEFHTFMPFLEDLIRFSSNNLFEYILNSIYRVCEFLGIKTKVIISSTIDCDHLLKSSDRVHAICKALRADTYINPIGGTELYEKEDFARQGITLRLLQPDLIGYPQGSLGFLPWLSIVDILMFNSAQTVNEVMLKKHAIR